MNALRIVLTIVMIAISVIITVIILMQEGKDQGLGAISGAAETYWGKNKGRSMEGNLLRWTVILVIAFFALAMLLNMSIF
ncbi:MAG: preprotein translocase subunit SecG [Lachnospiraceae bacterium]|jgi:preprotein translocase subunit SecG|nr:preprotein translocase subunit SecG [Lachnospiraceae bacterium]MCH4029303.1 preprotein translocase subunit SecG [Lachnospiraceae bacterium]MCH4067846.1 preprotein translocase subunit SecG [Lachnospiraceae bacterium]MCH4113870.1 preprotein translocase subunit SecG [Lachnospiraceae bacterium]MDD5847532.1 preprotein translocase subunit SecG [Lachnospiraceae bacterium]